MQWLTWLGSKTCSENARQDSTDIWVYLIIWKIQKKKVTTNYHGHYNVFLPCTPQKCVRKQAYALCRADIKVQIIQLDIEACHAKQWIQNMNITYSRHRQGEFIPKPKWQTLTVTKDNSIITNCTSDVPGKNINRNLLL